MTPPSLPSSPAAYNYLLCYNQLQYLPSLLSSSLSPLVVSSIHCFHNFFWLSFFAEAFSARSISSSFGFLAYFFTASIYHSASLSLKILTPNAAHLPSNATKQLPPLKLPNQRPGSQDPPGNPPGNGRLLSKSRRRGSKVQSIRRSDLTQI